MLNLNVNHNDKPIHPQIEHQVDYPNGFQSAKFFRNGTHRLVSPEQTLARVQPLMPEMGITRIANITGLDFIGIPVVTVCRPNSRSISVSQGKGITLAAAKASGLMEAVELYHAESITLPLKLCSYEEMRRTHCVVDVAELPAILNSRFHPHLPLLWIEGYDLLHKEAIWLPYEAVHTNATWPEPSGSGCFAVSSNGLASGNHLLEAVSHGICEIVERDATTLWNFTPEEGRQNTRIDLSTIDDPNCRELLNRCETSGVSVLVWDMTTDIGIATFQCGLVERTADPQRLIYASAGMGCHPDRSIALTRALTEAAQCRLTLISGARDDIFRPEYDQDFRQVDLLIRQQALLDQAAPRRFQEVPSWESETLDEDLAQELARLQAAQITRVIVVDLTKPEFGIPVVRVVIPGLESLWQTPRYQPGTRARARLEAQI